MTLYLAYFNLPPGERPRLDLDDQYFPLQPDLYLIETGLTRSKLYHRIKWQLPDGTPLLVAPLADDPKFKGMADGALKWVRERAGTAG